jgi:hypothetical protein
MLILKGFAKSDQDYKSLSNTWHKSSSLTIEYKKKYTKKEKRGYLDTKEISSSSSSRHYKSVESSIAVGRIGTNENTERITLYGDRFGVKAQNQETLDRPLKKERKADLA